MELSSWICVAYFFGIDDNTDFGYAGTGNGGIGSNLLLLGGLLIMNQMISFEVNHMFANFMPLRLAGSLDFYNRYEIYRFAGRTFDGIVWCPIVALVLSVGMAALAVWRLHRKKWGCFW